VPRTEHFVPSAFAYWRILRKDRTQAHSSLDSVYFARNDRSSWPLLLQLNNSEEFHMPVILWLLGVPLSVIVIAALFGAF
jgi:hypothetical protein